MKTKGKRRSCQELAHDTWFREQIEFAVQEADDPAAEWVSQRQMKRQSATDRAVWKSGFLMAHELPVRPSDFS
jgi:hypothetical protein